MLNLQLIIFSHPDRFLVSSAMTFLLLRVQGLCYVAFDDDLGALCCARVSLGHLNWAG